MRGHVAQAFGLRQNERAAIARVINPFFTPNSDESSMPIPVACKCGQKFAAKDEFAGKVMKCPKCGNGLEIPAPPQGQAATKPNPALQARGAATARSAPAAPRGPSLADLFDEAGVKPEVADNRPRCPQCKEPMATADAILCVNCGFNVETGKRLHGLATAHGADKNLYGLTDEGGHGSAAKSVLRKAEKAIKDDKIEEYKIRTQGMPVWALAIMFGCLVTFGVGMSTLPAAQALWWTGIVLAILPGAVGFIHNIMILVIAFNESAKEGVCCLLIPFYIVYYSCTRWKQCGRLFTIMVICSVLSGLGGGLTGISPQFKVEEQPTHPK